jgi:tetratricopeptide (TPR) repeat protein
VALAGLPLEGKDWSTIAPLVDEARALFERSGDYRGLAACLRLYGYVEQKAKRYEAALAYYRSSLALSRAVKHIQGIGESLRFLASVAEAEEDVPQAQEYYQQALAMLEGIADSEGASIVRTAMADVGSASGEKEGRR